jgi:flavin reductase (DIM6/NTAB) family NADH-FMN oxidoreductase RutF
VFCSRATVDERTRIAIHVLDDDSPRRTRRRCGKRRDRVAEANRGFIMAPMHIDPERIEQADRYKLLIGCIVPRPIAWVSTIAPDGSSANLAPFSFFNGVGSNPMTLLFCPANKPDGSEKDSLRNAKPVSEGGSGEFVVNIATDALAKRMAATSEPLPYGESEFELAGLATETSQVVRPPRVKESPVAFECRTVQVIRTNLGAPAAGNIVIGRVVHLYVRDDLINDRHHIDQARLDAIGRMGGLAYTRTRDRFELPMGKSAMV